MKRNTLTGFALALLAFPALTQAQRTIDRQEALDSLLAAEKAFADDAAAKGIRDSFLDFLADDGVIFRPDPVNGKEYLRSHPPSPGFLSWMPVYSEISMGGDLGYNTGPYEYREKAGDKDVDPGQFATVWQRQADGTWKVLVDLGTAGPAAAPPAATAPPVPANRLKGPPSWPASHLPAAKIDAAKAAVLAADRTLGEVAKAKGGAAAYATVLCDDARLLREGVAPIVGKEAVRAAVAKGAEPQSWEVAGGGVARSGDLGYTYGFVLNAAAPGGPAKVANYLRVWRQVADGSWKLAFDVLAPRPKLQPAAPPAPAGLRAPSPAPDQTPPTIPPLHPSEPSPPPPAGTGNGTENG
jgi:ketosteroid isomerase-like protein